MNSPDYICFWPYCACRPDFRVTSALPLKAAGQAFHGILSACDPEQTVAPWTIGLNILRYVLSN
jgi:hypothetical protein